MDRFALASPRRARGRALAAAAGALIALLGAACRPQAQTPRAPLAAPRNVVLITLDTTRADALGAYGQPLPASPNLDRLAGQGVLFERVETTAPTTLPAHASILTGRFPYAHGARANSGYVLSRQNLTLAELLRERGLRTAAEVAAPVIGRRTQIDQGFEFFRDTDSFDSERNSVVYLDENGLLPLELPERAGGDVTRHGLAFLRAHREEPFFLWLHYFDPHVLRWAPEAFRHQMPTSPYLAEVLYADYQVGRVAHELVQLGLAEDTLVVVTADHGEGLEQHGERTHTFLVYESTMRVPLILWGPSWLPRGLRIPAPVRVVDILPTVLDLLGAPIPDGVQGRSLRPLLDGSAEDLDLVGYGESIDGYVAFGTSILRFVREGSWKYIHKVEPELYDLAEDPEEQHNLASREPEVVERLRARLRQQLADAPAAPEDAAQPVDAETLSELSALGYVTGGSAPTIPDELATLELSGPDPNSLLAAIERLGAAHGAYRMKHYELALEILSELDRRYPDRVPLLGARIDALLALERGDEAIPLLRRSLEIDPGFAPHRLALARLLAERGAVEEAESLLRAAVERDPCASGPRLELANLLRDQGRRPEQHALLEQGVEVCPDSTALVNELAYALATAPEESLRDGGRALALIQPIAEAQASRSPAVLDTAAAAHAELGDFERALELSRQALDLVQRAGLPAEAVAEFRRNRDTIRAHQPVRQP